MLICLKPTIKEKKHFQIQLSVYLCQNLIVYRRKWGTKIVINALRFMSCIDCDSRKDEPKNMKFY